MNKINLFFWDFDGTICDSPLPETHKPIWKEKTGTDWPYQGWWGRIETLDPNNFDIKLLDKNVNILKSEQHENNKHFVLTSRLLKFRDNISNILKNHKIDNLFEDIYTVNKYDKGQRILQFVQEWNDKGFIVHDVNFFDDRDKEIVATENVRKQVEHLITGSYNITKV